MEIKINLDINLDNELFDGLRIGDENWTGGVKKPPDPVVDMCQDEEDISESGDLSKLFRTRQMPMEPSLLPVKTLLLFVVIVLIVEL